MGAPTRCWGGRPTPARGRSKAHSKTAPAQTPQLPRACLWTSGCARAPATGLLEVVEHQESLVPHRGRHVAREGSTSRGRGRALETCFPVAHRTWEKWTKLPFPKLWKLLKTCNNPKSACPVISNLLGQSIKRNLCDHQLITKLTKQRFQWLTMIKNTDLQNQSREDIKQIATTISSRGGDSDFQSRHVVLFKTYNFK